MSEATGEQSAAWPRRAFEAPVLRALGERERAEVAAAGRIRRVRAGELVYQAREASDAFFVVVSGNVELRAVRRGDDAESVVRVARRGDTFGEEALLVGALRWATASAGEPAELAEVPVAVLLRVAERSGRGEALEREQRALRRAATHDLLRTTALGRDLSEDDLDLLLDAVRHERVARSERIFRVGDSAGACFVVADGLVQLQTEDDGKIQVRAYLSRGDFFGDQELVTGERRQTSAVALGDCQLLRVPAATLTTLADRNPGLIARLRRLAADRAALQHELVGAAQARSTQHVFKDLYRMQMARSLLAIDQETCVRCGHCAWACAEVHGEARLVRRGDKIVTHLGPGDGVARSLMLPNSCQHCKNPVCMLDCPTGAIGRDPEGEVFIREELCTGCGACAKACPWDNIRMSPRGGDGPAEVAVKCDLCRDYEAPACVQACPTESIVRLDPARDFQEVGRLFGTGPEQTARRAAREIPWISGALAAALALGAPALVLRAEGVLRAGRGIGLVSGWLAGALLLALAGHALPKRLVCWWMVRRDEQSGARRAAGSSGAVTPPTRSRVSAFAFAHTALGLVAVAAVAAHAGPRLPPGLSGALALAFWLTALSGAFGAAAYRFLPVRLSRLERKGLLPEDMRSEREALLDRLYRAASGKSELVKRLMERVLLPYARDPLGPVRLAASGRSLAREERHLRARIDRTLEGRGGDKLAGVDDLVRIVVELRALPARRALTALLRSWLPLHVILTCAVLALLVLHVTSTLRW